MKANSEHSPSASDSDRKRKPPFSREGVVIALVLVCSSVLVAIIQGLSPETVGTAVGGGLAGFVLGLLPYLTGRKRCLPVARVSMWLCVAGGALGGAIIAFPLAIVLLIVVLAVPRKSPTTPQ